MGHGINYATVRREKLPLHDLVISDNRLKAELPRSLCNQTALRHFWASNDSFSGRVPPCRFWTWKFPDVEVFDVEVFDVEVSGVKVFDVREREATA